MKIAKTKKAVLFTQTSVKYHCLPRPCTRRFVSSRARKGNNATPQCNEKYVQTATLFRSIGVLENKNSVYAITLLQIMIIMYKKYIVWYVKSA